MRQIKFRAWDIVFQKMFYPSQKSRESSGLYEGGGHTEYLNNILYDLDYRPMQFTGLYDKNGKEIYEGDVVNNPVWGYPLEIIYDNTRARFVCKLKSGLTITIVGELLTVIGNIYENPDLV